MTFKPLLLHVLLPLVLLGCGSTQPPTPATEVDIKTADYVVLTPEQLKASAIDLAVAGPAKLRETVSLYGRVSPDAERVREVAARYPGVIRSVARKIGDSVHQGEPLATVESNESLQTYSVTAPIAGVVTERHANAGEQTGDKALFVIVDLTSVWIELSLFARDAPKVRVGQSVAVRSSVTDFVTESNVTYVGSFNSSADQTLVARVQVTNPQNRWTPGLYVTGDVTLAELQVPLAVRTTAIQILDQKPVVFIQGTQGFEPRPVALGRSDGTHSEVLQGLRLGDIYAATNSYVLKAEALKSQAAED